MRIYLDKPKTITKPSGATTSYFAPAFYNDVPDKLAQEWIDAGDARHASANNEILDEAPKPAAKAKPAAKKGG